MEIKAVIDRFESDKAVLLIGEFETAVIWPKNSLPTTAKEGDYLIIQLSIDEKATGEAKNEADQLLKELLADNK
jgi:hypothetical protein